MINTINLEAERLYQEAFGWERGETFGWHSILGHFIVQSVLDIGKQPSLLDIACGDGILTSEFVKHFERVVAVDASSIHIEKAQQRCPQTEFHVSLIESFNNAEKFDTVVLTNLLEHVVNPIITLRAAGKHLKHDGILIAQVPNALAVNRHIARLMGTLKDEYELSPWDINVAGHRRSYDMQSLMSDFKSAGLKIISTGGIFYKMLSTPQIDWLLTHGPWNEGGYGWGRVGAEKDKDWRWEFCQACYEYGKKHPEDCNIIYVCAKKNISWRHFLR